MAMPSRLLICIRAWIYGNIFDETVLMKLQKKTLSIITHGISVLVFCHLFYLLTLGGFGSDPIKELEHFTGKTAINYIFIIVLIPIISKVIHCHNLFTQLKALGLYCFTWATLHLSIYIILDLGFDLALFFNELTARLYLAIGGICWLILLLMALTSSKKAQCILGKYWSYLHKLIYIATILTSIHYIMAVKSGKTEAYIYLTIALLVCTYKVISEYKLKERSQT
ncbi:sulfite oxidase heme-binding subunit YedZ [Plesiomonas shigelloides]|uniref:sulfite oxidase heme-binding subunit YedZ n=2 Tax=Plesiomonas shigelloides TaxID=703 RepID=UPI0009EF41BE|nr:sulfoxide reductase heme-binding subunit YedZ [Plesiomonas shigelloides]